MLITIRLPERSVGELLGYHLHNNDNQVRANPSNSLTFHWSFNSSVDNYEQEVIFTYSYRGDFAKTDCSQKRIFRLKAKKIKKYAKPNHGIFLFSP